MHRLSRLRRGPEELKESSHIMSRLPAAEQVVQFFPYFTGIGPQNIPAGDQDDPQSLFRAGISGFTSGIPLQPL